MGQIIKQENYHVVVEPSSKWFLHHQGDALHKEYKEACEEIVSEINRHVDGVNYASVESDHNAYCEHCGHGWTEASFTYNGGCCEKDEMNNPDFERHN